MPISKKDMKRILAEMNESDKAELFVKAGIGFALANNISREGLEDLVDNGFNLLRAVIIGDLINTVAQTLVPKGKPPSISDLIQLFNELMSHQADCCRSIEKYHSRFVTMVETLTAKPESVSSTKH